MFALLAILLSASPSPAAGYWNFDDIFQQDFNDMEAQYIQQRVEDGQKLRERVKSYAWWRGGLKEMEEWSEDNLHNAPTNIDFTTRSGLDCHASVATKEIKCVKLQ